MNEPHTPAIRQPFGGWLHERLGISGLSYPVLEHANTLPYMLGGITLVGFTILFLTGLYLGQFYNPHPDSAHRSVVYIITGVPMGDFVRSLHYWAAHAVTVSVILHMCRILYCGSYKRPRELNWYIGLSLLGITFAFLFTGSVLKFDQEGWEALQHNTGAAELVGRLGAWFLAEFSRSVPLLTRLFVGHVTVLPLIFVSLAFVHLFLLKQHGISPLPTTDSTSRNTRGEGSSSFFSHLRRLMGYGLLFFAVVSTLALFSPAPLGHPAVKGAEVTKPWWMFVWMVPAEELWGLQALVVIPLILGFLLALVPVLDRGLHLHPARRKIVVGVSSAVLLIIVASGVAGALLPITSHMMN